MTGCRWCRAFIFAVCLAVFACVPAGPAHQGVLVGLTSGRTLWIAWPNDSARLIAEKPYLVVPREDGWWWVGVAGQCTWGEGGGGWVEDTLFVSLGERVFVARPGEEAIVPLGGMPCDQAEQEVLAERAKGAPATVDTTTDEEHAAGTESLYCERSTRRVTFVSPTVLSVEARHASTEFCSPAKYYTSGDNHVTRLGSNERIALRPLLPPEARQRLEGYVSDSSGCGYPAEDPGAQIDSTWAIGRHEARWVAQLWIEGPVVCRGGQEIEDGEPLPESFTGDSPLPIAWSEIVRQLPNTLDAVASPLGEYLLALRADSLMLVPIIDGQLGTPRTSIHVGYGEALAMIRWATVDEARRWSATLPALAPPRIRIVADSGTESP